MAIISVEHPDILDFIHLKSGSEFAIPNFNTSVSLSDRFMTQLEQRPDEPWICKFGGKEYLPRECIRSEDGKISSIKGIDITTREVFELLVKCAHCFGDPGCVFLDTANKYDPSGLTIYASNPCGTLLSFLVLY